MAELAYAHDLPAGRQAQNRISMYLVYAIKSIEMDYIYVGMSDNVERRVEQHSSGYNRTTRPYRPFKLIYTEKCVDRRAARLREKHFKSGCGRDFLRALLEQ